MGDRVSISFKKGVGESIALFHHWGGKEFPEQALKYAKALKKERGDAQMMPIDRLEPETVIVDFIRELTKGKERIESSIYLGKDENDGDNSDNGHFIIDLDKMVVVRKETAEEKKWKETEKKAKKK